MSIPHKLESRLENVKGLPSPPRVALQIIDAANDPDINLARVADIVTSDPVISAKVLRMANSAAYAVRGGCTTLRRALLTLGLDATLIVALSFTLVKALRRGKTTGLDLEYFWQRSLLSATAAGALGKALNRIDCETLFLAALLQDIGLLALDKCQPDLYAETSDLERDHRSLIQYEMALLECSHADVGQWLLRRWKLPETIIEAIACSHDPITADGDEFTRCVALSGPLADVWLASDWSQPFSELVEMAATGLGLNEFRLGTVLDLLRDRIPETEAMFEKDLIDSVTCAAAMDEARELLMEKGVDGIVADLKKRNCAEAIAPIALLRLQHRTELKEKHQDK